ncbi:putative hsp90-like protein [Rosellinia necatrix]|uniref:histidine kinase n=1 Tax=Rosellinia necatrix TaxID=77044 RepID=A0A1S8A6F9_ROSNE|nr:putative hsp90-like protein [Rosellinia necatrix]
MRIAIREQLAALVLLAVLIALTIVSVPTWIYVQQFVINVKTDGLSLTASLKAAQIASQIELIQTTCTSIVTRLLVQGSFLSFYRGNQTEQNWFLAVRDIHTALNSGGASNLLQAKLFSRNETGDPNGLANVTADNVSDIKLPYTAPDGSAVYLGNTTYGYPPTLYPNITYYSTTDPDPLDPNSTVVVARPFPDIRIDSGVGGLVLGPLVINESYALMSLTLPIRQTSMTKIILGYMTVVAEATPIINIITSREGLGETGSVLLIGPATGWNRFSKYNLPANSTSPAAANFSSVDVQFVLPPVAEANRPNRHTKYDWHSGNYGQPFQVTEYNAAYKAFTARNSAVNNASSMLSTTNEQGIAVAVGYARPPTALVNWTLIVEQNRSEAFIPINTLQHILLGTVFGTAGVVLLFIVPCAHLSVKPIRRLKFATEKSIAPPGYAEAYVGDVDDDEENHAASDRSSDKMPRGIWAGLEKWYTTNLRPRVAPSEHQSDSRRHVFRIPGKVSDRKHIITDELTELTTTFNEMSDELLRQYTSLEDKVAQRTRELEESKKAAEAANESKTLFIANISHELKTPLNGILGMASVCMEEDDLPRIKQSLNLLYKSGDLLFHLLEDLLNFSKNQIGRQLSLDEKEFRLGDIRSQIRAIFDKQVREGQIVFSVDFSGADILEPDQSPDRNSIDERLPVLGPRGVGRLKDMCLWGDQHRILQVLINLVSNSLKFTPAHGRVSVRIRCVGEADGGDESRTSSFSRNTSSYHGRLQHRGGSVSNNSTISRDTPIPGTALSINPLDPKITPHLYAIERSPTPPLVNTKPFLFEFEVEDTGPGIPEHMRTRVFEPFVQGDLGLTKKFGGTGLGLSICQQLANLMGGSITMTSTLGVGTTFTMRIPLKYMKDRPSSTASSSINSRPASIVSAEGEVRRSSLPQTTAEAKASVLDQQPRLVGLSQPFFAATPKAGPSPTPDDHMKAVEKARADKGEGKLRVLVAEDNPTNIEVVSRMLKLEDVYNVTIAKDGQEAYDLVKANMENNAHFDLIFMDIQMPNVDGLQSTRLIRQMGYSAPIVALTAFSDESNVKNCIESGMNEFLSKPIRRPALKRVLKKFATIPEEPETTIKPPPKKIDPIVTSQPVNGGFTPDSTDSKELISSNGSLTLATAR